jgi:predicted  nucleic acid-binding Zn ribbon protein
MVKIWVLLVAIPFFSCQIGNLKMIIAEVRFKQLKPSNNNKDDLRDIAEEYLSSLRKFGQIYGETVLAWAKNELYGLVKLAGINAFLKKYHTKYSLDSLQKIKVAFSSEPTWKIIENTGSKNAIHWQKARFFYLLTHAFDDTSPLCSGETGHPIPLYLLPIEDLERKRAYFWAESYRHLDNIWLTSGELEIPAYKQLVEPNSGLSKEGRILCETIEKRINIPTYYFLNRYWERRTDEENRACPNCGKNWRIKEDYLSTKGFHDFVFRCESCRLVSHLGNSFEDERKARIGEYKRNR